MRRALLVLLLCAGLLSATYSTHNVSWQRTLAVNAAFVGDSIEFTARFINNESDTLHGFYFAEHIPTGFSLSFENAFIDTAALFDLAHETTASSALYPQAATQRTIFETPPEFTENNAIAPGDTLTATFWVRAQTATSFTLGNAHWIGYFTQGSAAFAASDEVLTVTFIERDLTILEDPLADGTVDENYQTTLQASGGTPPYSWSVSNGSLPAGLTLDSLSGTISGIPQQPGDFSFDISVRDSGLIIQQAQSSFELHIENPTTLFDDPSTPQHFALMPAYPNPFNPSVTLRYSLPKQAYLELAVFNSLGQPLKCLFNGTQEEGMHSLVWDGKNESGEAVGSGVYYIILKGAGETKSQKVLLIR